jgi:uncharacterized protein YjcR
MGAKFRAKADAAIDAMLNCGDLQQAADSLGITPKTLRKWLAYEKLSVKDFEEADDQNYLGRYEDALAEHSRQTGENFA